MHYKVPAPVCVSKYKNLPTIVNLTFQDLLTKQFLHVI